jgi:hypothetical protein
MGFPKNSCRAYSDYADAKMKGWMCKKCKEKRLSKWQGENV